MIPVVVSYPANDPSQYLRIDEWIHEAGLSLMHGVSRSSHPPGPLTVIELSSHRDYTTGLVTLRLSFADPEKAMLFKLTFGGTIPLVTKNPGA